MGNCGDRMSPCSPCCDDGVKSSTGNGNGRFTVLMIEYIKFHDPRMLMPMHDSHNIRHVIGMVEHDKKHGHASWFHCFHQRPISVLPSETIAASLQRELGKREWIGPGGLRYDAVPGKEETKDLFRIELQPFHKSDVKPKTLNLDKTWTQQEVKAVMHQDPEPDVVVNTEIIPGRRTLALGDEELMAPVIEVFYNIKWPKNYSPQRTYKDKSEFGLDALRTTSTTTIKGAHYMYGNVLMHSEHTTSVHEMYKTMSVEHQKQNFHQSRKHHLNSYTHATKPSPEKHHVFNLKQETLARSASDLDSPELDVSQKSDSELKSDAHEIFNTATIARTTTSPPLTQQSNEVSLQRSTTTGSATTTTTKRVVTKKVRMPGSRGSTETSG